MIANEGLDKLLAATLSEQLTRTLQCLLFKLSEDLDTLVLFEDWNGSDS